jgi:hypothetical protein
MSYTPGPWFVPERTGTPYVEARIGGGWLQEVAACGPTEKPEEQRANARLIAAAPQLLQALESIFYCCDEDHAARDYASRQAEIRGIAIAALRAAKGEA